MSETRSLLIAAKDVDVWRIPESDNRRIPAATKLSCDKELTGVPSRRLVAKIRIVGWHKGLTFQISVDCYELWEELLGSLRPFRRVVNAEPQCRCTHDGFAS